MVIRAAVESDRDIILRYDRHISKDELEYSIKRDRVILVEDNNTFVGWLRYNLFWDNTPFMNMLCIVNEFQGKGFGKALTLFWESKMKALGYKLLMTSTLSNEEAQHFYRKLDYNDAGALILPNEPLEIIFTKNLTA